MIFLRKITEKDIKQIFEWANDPEARKFAVNSNLITWEEHAAWFNQKLKDSSCFFYILTDESDSNIGTIRFDKKDNDEYLLSYSIAKEQRGKGLGKEIIRLGISELKKEFNDFIITAFVKNNNIPSLKVFSKDFEKDHEEVVNGELFTVFKKYETK